MRFVVAAAGEIAQGERRIVEVAGRSIGVFNVEGEYFALRNRCPHQGGALCQGRLWGSLRSDRPGHFEYEGRRDVLTCPWHGWEFHLRTGQSWCDPERLSARSYDVAVVAGTELEDVGPADGPGGSPDRAAAPADRGEEPPAPGMVKGPYLAETYPVSREGAYLVIDVPSAGRTAGGRTAEGRASDGGQVQGSASSNGT